MLVAILDLLSTADALSHRMENDASNVGIVVLLDCPTFHGSEDGIRWSNLFYALVFVFLRAASSEIHLQVICERLRPAFFNYSTDLIQQTSTDFLFGRQFSLQYVSVKEIVRK